MINPAPPCSCLFGAFLLEVVSDIRSICRHHTHTVCTSWRLDDGRCASIMSFVQSMIVVKLLLNIAHSAFVCSYLLKYYVMPRMYMCMLLHNRSPVTYVCGLEIMNNLRLILKFYKHSFQANPMKIPLSCLECGLQLVNLVKLICSLQTVLSKHEWCSFTYLSNVPTGRVDSK